MYYTEIYIEIIFPSGIVSMEIRISDLINIVFTKETQGLEYKQVNHCNEGSVLCCEPVLGIVLY
jgi:hypothetical protein